MRIEERVLFSKKNEPERVLVHGESVGDAGHEHEVEARLQVRFGLVERKVDAVEAAEKTVKLEKKK